MADAADPRKMSKKITILFLAANPQNTPLLRLDTEARTIEERLRLSKGAERFVLHTQWATRTNDVLDALLRFQPDIVHFSGHGDEHGNLAFEDAAGGERMVGLSGLAMAINGVGNTRCVFLNACFSNRTALILSDMVDCVIGMNSSVDDEAATNFASGFYRSIGEGMSVKKAFELGRAQVAIDGGKPNIPHLRLRNDVDISF